MHEQYLDLLTHLKPNGKALKLMKQLIVRVWNDEVKLLHSSRIKAQKRIDELETHKQNAVDKVVNGDISVQEKLALQERADMEIARAKGDIDRLADKMGTKQEAIDYVLSFMGNAPRLWWDASTEMRVKYQAMMFPHGIVYDFKTNIFGTAKISSLYTLAGIKKESNKSSDSLLVTPAGFEPAIFWMRTRYPGPLDEGALLTISV